MSEPIPIENPSEYTTDRTETVFNTPGGTDVWCGVTGQERRQISCSAGNTINMNNKTFSMFAPNQSQSLTLGQKFSTVGGNSYEFCKKHVEKKSYGDFTIITGSPNFFSDELANLWVENNRNLSTLINSKSRGGDAIGNNSNENQSKAKSGSTLQKAIKETAESNIDIEKRMGEGGSAKILSCKHIYLQAGQRAINFDTGALYKKGKKVTKKYTTNSPYSKTSQQFRQEVDVPVYDSNDTSSSAPFGDIHLNAMGKINMQSGSGGMSIQSSGESKINSTGRLSLGGAEVAIGSGTKNSAGRVTVKADMDVFVETGTIITMTSPNIVHTAGNQILLETPQVHCTRDVYIYDDLEVGGNLLVHGNIRAYGAIWADADIVAGIGSRNISLLTHIHPHCWGHYPGCSYTSSPKTQGRPGDSPGIDKP